MDYMDTRHLIKKRVIHFIYFDNKGRIYCRMENKIIKLKWDKCYGCPLLCGSLQGQGVECYYEDLIDERTYYSSNVDNESELQRITITDVWRLPIKMATS